MERYAEAIGTLLGAALALSRLQFLSYHQYSTCQRGRNVETAFCDMILLSGVAGQHQAHTPLSLGRVSCRECLPLPMNLSDEA